MVPMASGDGRLSSSTEEDGGVSLLAISSAAFAALGWNIRI